MSRHRKVRCQQIKFVSDKYRTFDLLIGNKIARSLHRVNVREIEAVYGTIKSYLVEEAPRTRTTHIETRTLGPRS